MVTRTRKGRLAKVVAVAVISTLLPYAPVSTHAAAPSVAALLAQFPVIVPPDFVPLSQIPVPEPSNIFDFVKNKPAAIRLGKAFFWDMQVGSDGIQACASCHHSAGIDNRMKNTLNPGAKAGDAIFGNNNLPGGIPGFPQFGPNYTLQPGDFPFHQRGAPADLLSSPILRHTNDVVGSQGVRRAEFNSIILGSAVDDTTLVADPVFNVGGVNTRRVTGRNTPSMINAIFNFSNFWDGRAHHNFNGANPFGPADVNAGVWFNDPVAGLVKRAIAFDFASLASQATGPPLDDTEMSARGRTFPELGRKLLSLTPLGKQLVHPGDNALGIFSQASRLPDGRIQAVPGLVASYSQMIRDAFVNSLWNSTATVVLQTIGGPVAFSQMEANFSLFWGLAVQLYMATLVADQTPFDRFLGGNTTALTDQQQLGLALFNGIAKCGGCHGGTEMTNASVTASAFLNNQNHALIELMFVADGRQVIYDNGYNNTAVTPTTDDLGRGGTAPFLNPLTGNLPFPLSFSALAELQELNRLTFDTPILDEFIPPDFPVNKDGLFKVPGLRNVELTAPYLHNGSVMTLEEVVDFYVRGGNFPQTNIHDLDPLIGEGIPLMQGNDTMHAALVAFMMALTDERVRNQSAPFDHPELLLPIPNDDGTDVLIRIAATDLDGAPAQTLLTLNPVTTPTPNASQTISGTVEGGLTPVVTVDTGATAVVTVSGTNWSALISGLAAGPNVITVGVTDFSGPLPTQTTLTATVTFLPDTAPVANNDSSTTNMNTAAVITVLANDTDAEGNIIPSSVAVGTVPAHGTAVVNPATGAVTYTPTLNYFGPDSFTYTVGDAAGNTSNVATVSVTVNGVIDTINVTRALYSQRVGQWTIQGTTSAPGSSLSFYAGPNATGPVIGSAVARTRGRSIFRFVYRNRNGVAPDATNTISVRSSPNGTVVSNIGVTIR
jgi:cytochrome c peroxidase